METDKTMSNNKQNMNNLRQMTEDVKLEVNKLQKQIDDSITNYCLSVSPYKVGDKILNEHGKLVIIDEIRINPSFFYEGMKQIYQRPLYHRNNLYDVPFYYRVKQLDKKEGKRFVHGIKVIYMYLESYTGLLGYDQFKMQSR